MPGNVVGANLDLNLVLDESRLDGINEPRLGDQNDMLSRILTVLPTGWYPDVAPVVQGVLSGAANMLTNIYTYLTYTKAQTRIATATDFWVDIIAYDFFGYYITRNPGETDMNFSLRIRQNLLRLRASRPAMSSAINELTGQLPVIIEPWSSGDCGAYTGSSMIEGGSLLDHFILDRSRLDGTYAVINNSSYNGLAYNTAGAYGSTAIPYQCFITCYRPLGGEGVAYASGYNCGGGGYGVGNIEYINPSLITGYVTDAQIYAEVARTIPAGTIAWVKIESGLSPLSFKILVLNHSSLDVSCII